jgi:hypothetical protein
MPNKTGANEQNLKLKVGAKEEEENEIYTIM